MFPRGNTLRVHHESGVEAGVSRAGASARRRTGSLARPAFDRPLACLRRTVAPRKNGLRVRQERLRCSVLPAPVAQPLRADNAVRPVVRTISTAGSWSIHLSPHLPRHAVTHACGGADDKTRGVQVALRISRSGKNGRSDRQWMVYCPDREFFGTKPWTMSLPLAL